MNNSKHTSDEASMSVNNKLTISKLDISKYLGSFKQRNKMISLDILLNISQSDN